MRSVGDLGETLHLDSGTLTPLLKRMERNGFVDRRRDSVDERRVLVDLSKRGRALRSSARCVPETLANRLNLDPAQMDDLREAVRAMVRTLADV